VSINWFKLSPLKDNVVTKHYGLLKAVAGFADRSEALGVESGPEPLVEPSKILSFADTKIMGSTRRRGASREAADG
jgi:hypothetical protein